MFLTTLVHLSELNLKTSYKELQSVTALSLINLGGPYYSSMRETVTEFEKLQHLLRKDLRPLQKHVSYVIFP